MPKQLEEKLKRQAREKFGTTTSEQARRYIFGTLQNKTSWTPKQKRHPSGNEDHTSAEEIYLDTKEFSTND